ncbi:MAG: 5-formyltetrahydrofolate cyclo-ligase [Pseudomonadota bacterium]
MSESDLARAKAALRATARTTRAAAARASLDAAERAAATALTELARHAGISTVAAYLAFRDEIDTAPLIDGLHAAGHTICLPVVETHAAPLRFRRWHPGGALNEGDYGILVPSAGDWLEPDALIVPLLAFDARGHRLGYGGGYYDRTIAALSAHRKILTIGLAFAAQQVDAVPHDSLDRPLDCIVTETGMVRPTG